MFCSVCECMMLIVKNKGGEVITTCLFHNAFISIKILIKLNSLLILITNADKVLKVLLL